MKQTPLKLHVLKVRQPIGDFYIAAIPAKELVAEMLDAGVHLAHLLDGLNPVLVRHHQIDDGDIEQGAASMGKPLLAVTGHGGCVPRSLKHGRQGKPHMAVIINNENVHWFAGGAGWCF